MISKRSFDRLLYDRYYRPCQVSPYSRLLHKKGKIEEKSNKSFVGLWILWPTTPKKWKRGKHHIRSNDGLYTLYDNKQHIPLKVRNSILFFLRKWYTILRNCVTIFFFYTFSVVSCLIFQLLPLVALNYADINSDGHHHERRCIENRLTSLFRVP
jgi:hypothetical protein